jgi:hypothetical protein
MTLVNRLVSYTMTSKRLAHCLRASRAGGKQTLIQRLGRLLPWRDFAHMEGMRCVLRRTNLADEGAAWQMKTGLVTVVFHVSMAHGVQHRSRTILQWRSPSNANGGIFPRRRREKDAS